jgi:hypothetical protein
MTDDTHPKPAKGHRATALDVLAELARDGKSERTRLIAARELVRATQPRARPERKPRPAAARPNAWARAAARDA